MKTALKGEIVHVLLTKWGEFWQKSAVEWDEIGKSKQRLENCWCNELEIMTKRMTNYKEKSFPFYSYVRAAVGE